MKNKWYKAKVKKVIDGDTLDLIIDFQYFKTKFQIEDRIRLDRINTPESRTKDLREKEAGLKAKEFVKEFLKDKRCQIHVNKRGKFGRVLGRIWIDDKCLNDELIKNGHARAYDGGKRRPWFE